MWRTPSISRLPNEGRPTKKDCTCPIGRTKSIASIDPRGIPWPMRIVGKMGEDGRMGEGDKHYTIVDELTCLQLKLSHVGGQ